MSSTYSGRKVRWKGSSEDPGGDTTAEAEARPNTSRNTSSVLVLTKWNHCGDWLYNQPAMSGHSIFLSNDNFSSNSRKLITEIAIKEPNY